MNDSAVRTLANVGGSGTVISMQDLLGKSANYTGIFAFNNSDPFSVQTFFPAGFSAGIQLQPNGSITLNGASATQGPSAYLTPLEAGAGSQFEVRAVDFNGTINGTGSFTIFGTTFTNSTSGTSAYVNLSTPRTIEVFPSQGDSIDLLLTLEIRRINTGGTIFRFCYIIMSY